MENDDKQVGFAIKNIRQDLGMTQQEFGDLFGANRSSVSKWESGATRPNKERLKQISKIGGIGVNEILYGGQNLNISVNDFLFCKLNKYVKFKKEAIQREIKLLADSAAEIFLQLVGKREGTEAVADYENHRSKIKKLNTFGTNYIIENFNNYTYKKFIKDNPNSNLAGFKEYKENQWQTLKEYLDNFWESFDITDKNNSWINSRFTNQIVEELNKISSLAIERGEENYYVNDIVQPFLDQAAKDFKEYIKENTDIE